jgi:response regulator RpfG family c-di-GMP phosphodiesterase
MPAMTGDVFLSELRKLLPDSNHATIMTSGIISLPKISELLQDGVDYFLPKPINLREFSDYINRVTVSKQIEKVSADNRATV